MECNVDGPRIGMLFEDIDSLKNMYKKYARKNGFSIKKFSGRKDGNGNHRYVTLGCHRGRPASNRSKNANRERPSSRTNCKARLCASFGKDGKWRINSIHLEHNHELVPSTARFLHQHREISELLKKKLAMNKAAGIRTAKTFRSMVMACGGFPGVGCTEKDCHNYIRKTRLVEIGNGDAEAVLQVFSRMQRVDQHFVYDVELDEGGRLKNLFWMDGRARAAYRDFGDVVSFDTTYLVNKYDMPFAPFVGINHHGHSILLGSALVSNEKAENFVWVFQNWLKAVGSIPPQGIITDQCGSIVKAMHEVFPQVRHHFCLWHIMSKFPLKMGSKNRYSDMNHSFKRLVYETVDVDLFENGWTTFLQEYGVVNEKWLLELFAIRKQWVPVYVNNYFWGGMASTQRSESMNAFFDGYINSRTTLKQFIEQYEVAVMSKIEKETKADFDCLNSSLATHTDFELEKHFQNKYTSAVYIKVRKQFKDTVYCKIVQETQEEQVKCYDIQFRIKLRKKKGWKRKMYKVLFEKDTLEVSCNCRMFESKGILCSHLLFVLNFHEVQSLPPKYTLARWMKGIRRGYLANPTNIANCHSIEEGQRSRELEEIFYSFLQRVLRNDGLFSFTSKAMRDIVAKINLMESESTDPMRSEREEVDPDPDINTVEGIRCVVRDPPRANRRGRPKSARPIPLLEKVQKRTRKRKRGKAAYNDEPSGLEAFGSVHEGHSDGTAEMPIPLSEPATIPEIAVTTSERLDMNPNFNATYFSMDNQSQPGFVDLLRGVEWLANLH